MYKQDVQARCTSKKYKQVVQASGTSKRYIQPPENLKQLSLISACENEKLASDSNLLVLLDQLQAFPSTSIQHTVLQIKPGRPCQVAS